MNHRWTLMSSISVLAMVAGGVLALVPLGLTLLDLKAPPERAPSSTLEAARRSVLGSIEEAIADASSRADALEELGETLSGSDAGPRRAHVADAVPKP